MIAITSLALLAFTACGPKQVPPGTSADDWTGQWQDEAGSVTTIEVVDRQLEVTSIIDYDDEVFIVQDTRLDGEDLVWEYDVPSTEYHLIVRARGADGQTFCTTWENQHGSGSDCYTKVGDVD